MALLFTNLYAFSSFLDDNQEKIAVAGAVFQLVGLLTHSNELVQFHSAAVLATLMVLTSIQLDLYRVSIYLYCTRFSANLFLSLSTPTV